MNFPPSIQPRCKELTADGVQPSIFTFFSLFRNLGWKNRSIFYNNGRLDFEKEIFFTATKDEDEEERKFSFFFFCLIV